MLKQKMLSAAIGALSACLVVAIVLCLSVCWANCSEHLRDGICKRQKLLLLAPPVP